MKRLLTIACVLFALAGSGQYSVYNRLPVDTIITPKYDTIPIIYLYCDTARRIRVLEEYGILNNKLIIERDTFYYEPNYELRWDFGYEIISDGDLLGYTVEPMTILKPVYERKSIGYLDRNKQPIRKVIIWQTKTIEK